MSIVQEKNGVKTEVNSLMDVLFKSIPLIAPKTDDLADGIVIGQEGPMLFIDIQPFGTGIIYGREFMIAQDTIKVLKPGDKITVKIVELKNELDYMSLSLKEANQEIVWREAEEEQKNKSTVEAKVVDANKGGLILEWKGIQGFLPTSQLKPEHYPRIDDGDPSKITEKLKVLVGERIPVTIISVSVKERKVIFSEKGAQAEETKEKVSKYKVGDIVDTEVTGIVDFGVFLKLEDGLEGLAHISELDWSLVDNPNKLFKVGDKTKAQIINIKDGKVSLSVKALKQNPWETAKEKYKKGDAVKGVIIKFNKHGALASIEEGVAGLVHISEFQSEADMKEKMALGKSYSFKISVFEPENQRLTLNVVKE